MQPDDGRVTPLDPDLDNHIIATSGYEGFPDFIQGYPYDDTIRNVTMPNILGLTSGSAVTVLANAGITTYSSTTSSDGATSGNNGKVKSQNPGIGSVLNYGDSVSFVTYNYTAATTGPVAGFNRTPNHFTLNGNEAVMYVVGRTVKPAIGWTITVSGTSQSSYNQNWIVEDIANDDSYNTGGTAVKLVASGSFTGSTSSSGTWTKV
jgi:hypothetical protein